MRWTQLDPSNLEYVYANGNPVNFVDPSGYLALEKAGQTGYEYAGYGQYTGAGVGCAIGAAPYIAFPPVAAAGCLTVGAGFSEIGSLIGFGAGFLVGGLSE